MAALRAVTTAVAAVGDDDPDPTVHAETTTNLKTNQQGECG